MKFILSIAFPLIFFVVQSAAQEIFYNTYYSIEPVLATTAPKIGEMPEIRLKDRYNKNTTDGMVEASIVLGGDGTLHNATVVKSYSAEVDNSVLDTLKKIQFSPAKLQDKGVDCVLRIKFYIHVLYDAKDKSVTKPTITVRPDPEITPKMLKLGERGKVEVTVQFNDDGTLKVLGVNSVMSPDYDAAARKAAENIGFQPGTHKKTKNNVTVKMVVEYKF